MKSTNQIEIEGLSHFELIGHGGSSEVFRAHDDELDRTVAVKVYRFDGTVEDSARLFLRECRAADHLASHPEHRHDPSAAISEHGQPYVVMEEAAQGSVADLIRSGPIEVGRAVSLASGIVEDCAPRTAMACCTAT